METRKTPQELELLNFKLLTAINEKKTDDIKKIIADGADLSFLHEGKTPIEYASSKDLWGCVKAIAAAKRTDAEDSYHYGAVMLTAAEWGLSDTIKSLITAGAPVNLEFKHRGGFTILDWAVGKSDRALIKSLIEYGANLATKNHEGKTPIIAAAFKQNWATVECIAKAKKTDVQDSYDYGGAVLYATSFNKEATVKILLEAGAKTSTPYTGILEKPLHVAVKNGNTGIITLLLDHEADLAVVDADKQTPMQLAAKLEKWGAIECIAKKAKTAPLDRFGFNAALLAAEKAGRKGTVDLLLAAGTPATGMIDGTPLLHRAIASDDLTMIEKLIANGADLAATDSNKHTAMDYAVYHGKWQCVEKIAGCKSNDDKDTYHYGKALAAAVQVNRKSTVDKLLHAKAMINHKSNASLKTVMHTAIDNASEAILVHLTQHGSDLSAVNGDQLTPMQHLAHHGLWECIKNVAKARSADETDTYKYGSVLETAVYSDKYEAAKCLLEAKASKTWKRDGQGVLHRAVMNSNLQMLELLLKHGADMSAKNADGKTPMELAVELIRPKCAGVMIKHKTDQNDTYHYGQALLYIMQRGCSRNEVKAFIAAGACNLNTNAEKLFVHAVASGKLDNAIDIHAVAPNVIAAKDKEDGVLHLAVQNNDTDMLRFLLESGALQTSLNRSKQTPVELAAELGNWDCVQLLLEFDHQNGHNKQLLNDLHLEQALLTAIQKSHYAAAKLLLEHHAPCERWTVEHGNIALYWAVKNNERNPEMVSLLLEHGVDASLRNKDGKTMVEVARDMRHSACLARLQASSSMVKPGKSAEEYRQEANQYYEQLTFNATRPEAIPEVIRDMQACYRALLQCDLEALMQRREALKQKGDTSKLASSAISLIDFSSPDHELENINSLIMVINTLLNYPDKIPSPTLLRKHASQEDNDVTDYLKRKSFTDDYLRRVRVYLSNLDREIRQREWKVKTFLGTWVKGTPTSIKSILRELDKLPVASNADETYAIFVAIIHTITNIEKLDRRHELTSFFYDQQRKNLSAMSFVSLSSSPEAEQQALADKVRQSQSDAVALQSTDKRPTYQPMYPKIDDGQFVTDPIPVPQRNPAHVLMPQPVKPIDHTRVVESLQRPTPTAPSLSPAPDVVAAMPDVPKKMPVKQVSNSTLYQQPVQEKKRIADASKEKPRGKVVLLG